MKKHLVLLALLVAGCGTTNSSVSTSRTALMTATTAAMDTSTNPLSRAARCTPLAYSKPALTVLPTVMPASSAPLASKAVTDIGLAGAIAKARTNAASLASTGPIETVRACGPMAYQDASHLWTGDASILDWEQDLQVYAVELKVSFTYSFDKMPRPQGAPEPSPVTVTRIVSIFMTDGFAIQGRLGTDTNWVSTGTSAPVVMVPGQDMPQPIATPVA